jgi:serine/threonine protein kinase
MDGAVTPRSLDPTDPSDSRARSQPSPHTHGADLVSGDLVGDYRIESKLGHGGMGTVYAAVHPIIDKRVAIKVLRLELSESTEAVARFVQEARAVNRIRHPSIVDVFGYGTTADGRCFLVMELLDGESLGRRIEHAPPSIVEACDILIAITHALDAAHASGIVHRDLKPDNVFLVEGSQVKLLDFGIAKLTEPSERAPVDYTQPGQAMGTPRYIAPEQARGDAVDGRTDIYSLGVLAFELLVGRAPFVSDNAMELVAKHITIEPPVPSSLAALPPIADVLLLEMLAKEPAGRPSLRRVRELLDELRAPTAIEPAPAAATAVPADASTRALVAADRARWWIPLAAVAALAIAGLVAYRALGSDDESRRTEPAGTPESSQSAQPAGTPPQSARTPHSNESPQSSRTPHSNESPQSARTPRSDEPPDGSGESQSARGPQSSRLLPSDASPQAGSGESSPRPQPGEPLHGATRPHGPGESAQTPHSDGSAQAARSPRSDGSAQAARSPRSDGSPQAARTPHSDRSPQAARTPPSDGSPQAARTAQPDGAGAGQPRKPARATKPVVPAVAAPVAAPSEPAPVVTPPPPAPVPAPPPVEDRDGLKKPKFKK